MYIYELAGISCRAANFLEKILELQEIEKSNGCPQMGNLFPSYAFKLILTVANGL